MLEIFLDADLDVFDLTISLAPTQTRHDGLNVALNHFFAPQAAGPEVTTLAELGSTEAAILLAHFQLIVN